MTIRSITAIHSGYEFERSSLATAVELANALGALLRIVHVARIMQPTSVYFGDAAAMGTGVFEAATKQARADLERSRTEAERICRQHGLPLCEVASDALPRAEFIPLEGVSNRRLVRELALTDLVVKGAPGGNASWLDDSVANLALFSTTRPMLLVRPRDDGAPAPLIGQSACVAWRDTPEAIHAIVGSVDLLATATSVHILTASRSTRLEADEESMLAAYLSAHEISAHIEALRNDGYASSATTILEQARAIGCGYLAMGAYGHSMFREALLGGFSEDMISEADLPLVLCH